MAWFCFWFIISFIDVLALKYSLRQTTFITSCIVFPVGTRYQKCYTVVHLEPSGDYKVVHVGCETI